MSPGHWGREALPGSRRDPSVQNETETLAPSREQAVMQLQRAAGNAAVAAAIRDRTLFGGQRRAGSVLARDPLAGGAAGATNAATGGAVALQSVEGSFSLPGDKLLSGDWKARVTTEGPVIINARITSEEVRLTISPGLSIDAQWPVQNMVLTSVTHHFASEVTTVSVHTVNDEFGDGLFDATDTARSTVGDLVRDVISKTPLHRPTAPDPLDAAIRRPLGQPPGPESAPGGPLPHGAPPSPAPTPAPAYDPLQDASPTATLEALAAGFAALPGGGESDVKAADISHITVGATLELRNGVEQLDGGTGVRIAPGTAVSVRIDSGASVGKLKNAGQGAAAVAAAADIQQIHVTSGGIEVIKDGAVLATINEIIIHRGGKVTIESVTLLGAAKEAANTEHVVHAVVGGIGGFFGSGGSTVGAAAGAQNALDSHGPVLVPGIVRGVLEAKLQQAFTQLLATQGRTLFPGVDIGSVLGVPGAPVTP